MSEKYKITYGEHARKELSTITEAVIRLAMEYAGVPHVIITSTRRTVEDQARIMYDNIMEFPKAKTVSELKEARGWGYKAPGRQVEDVYYKNKDKHLNDDQMKALLAKEIDKLEKNKEVVSNHIADVEKFKGYNVLDLAFSAVGDAHSAFSNVLWTMASQKTSKNEKPKEVQGVPKDLLKNLIFENACWHVEIDQSNEKLAAYGGWFSFPIKGADAQSCLQARLPEIGGTYPLGMLNKSWHAGIHLATSKPALPNAPEEQDQPDAKIVAVAPGRVVAYRFCEYSGDETDNKPYSNSFVLLKHQWNSTFGNKLDFYSLYMHLDPKPSGEYLPAFLYGSKPIAGGNDSLESATGQVLFKEKSTDDSIALIPINAKVTVDDGKSNKDWLHVTYLGCDGFMYTGYIRNKTVGKKSGSKKSNIIEKHVIETDEATGAVYIALNGETTYGSKSKPYKACVKTGVFVRDKPIGSGVIVGFIPNKGQDGKDVELQFESIDASSEWVKLISPLPQTIIGDTYYIQRKSIKRKRVGEVDESKLGSLQIPSGEDVDVDAGETIGRAYNHRDIKLVPFFHHEIFTLSPLLDEKSVLNDPHGERYFSKESKYLVKKGADMLPLPARKGTLKEGDHVKVINKPVDSEYMEVEVAGLVRDVKHDYITYQKKHEDHSNLFPGTTNFVYKAKDLDSLNSSFNGWMEKEDEIYTVKKFKTEDKYRTVYFSCMTKSKRFWISQSCKLDDLGTLGVTPAKIYYQDPKVTEEKKSEELMMLDSPEVIPVDQKRYAKVDNDWMVDITNIEPETPFTWPGFELMYEDPANHDAFVDIDKLKTQVHAEKKLEPTDTAKELLDAIKVDNDGAKFDISKVAGNRTWKNRLSQLIIRCPSEWQYNDEKYASLKEKMGDEGDPEKEKN